MAVNTFPSIGQLLHRGYSEGEGPQVLASDMESGPSKMRLLDETELALRKVTYKFTQAELAQFLTWYRSTIKKVDWFNWTDPRTQQSVEVRIKGGQIGEPTPTNPQASHWVVPFVLEYYA